MNGAAIAPSWDGHLILTPMGAVFAGTGGDTPVHCHLAHKIIIGATAAGPCHQLRAGDAPIAIPAGQDHRVLAAGRRVILAYLDARRYRWADAARLAERWRAASPATSTDGLVDELTRIAAWSADARAVAAIEAMAGGRSLVDVSAALGLSESRVTHLVSEQLGAPPRAWRTWLRLRDAVERLGDGALVTTAAHAAGFADAAHLSRTCSTTLGIPPSTLRRTRIARV
jgi:AraC-like DNA-binding protein